MTLNPKPSGALKMAEDVHSIVACTFAVLQLGNIVFEADTRIMSVEALGVGVWCLVV